MVARAEVEEVNDVDGGWACEGYFLWLKEGDDVNGKSLYLHIK